MIGCFLRNIFRTRFVFNPLILYNLDNLGNFIGINSLNRSTKVIVTLLYDKNFIDELPITLYSLLNQKIKPDKVVLWVPKTSECYNLNNLPYSITRFIKNGLEVCFVNNLYKFTNIYYAFKKFSKSIIVMAENNVYFKEDWLEKLYYSYIANPKDIHVHKAKQIALYATKKSFLPTKNWKDINKESVSYFNFFNIYGGVLFPPNCFLNEILRYDIFNKYANNSQYAWLWIMSILNNRNTHIVKNSNKSLYFVNLMKMYKFSERENLNIDQGLIKLKSVYGTNVFYKLLNQLYK